MKIETDKYKLYNGDCLEIMDNIDDESIDLIITDPPYKTTKRGGTGNSGGMCKKKEFSNGNGGFKYNNVKSIDYISSVTVLEQKAKIDGNKIIEYYSTIDLTFNIDENRE